MKTQPYSKLWQRMHKSAKDKGFPLRVMFELTYKCNFFCRHCYVPLSYREEAEREELNTEEVFLILEQLKDIGCFYLGFTGGEPFTRKDIMKILRYAKKCGFEIIVYTNGSLIDETVAWELARLAPNKVDITIPAISKGAFDSISGLSGSKERVFKAIKLLHKNKVNLGFKTCVLKENESEIIQIENFAKSLEALHRLDNRLSPRLDGSKEPYNYRGKLKESPKVFDIESNIRAQHNLKECDYEYSNNPTNPMNSTNPINSMNPNDLTDLFGCGVGKTQVAINPFGELKMCLLIDYPKYKILGTSLKDQWERLKALVSSIKPDKNYRCDKCELQFYCKWCPAKSWLDNASFTSCIFKTASRHNKQVQERMPAVLSSK